MNELKEKLMRSFKKECENNDIEFLHNNETLTIFIQDNKIDFDLNIDNSITKANDLLNEFLRYEKSYWIREEIRMNFIDEYDLELEPEYC